MHYGRNTFFYPPPDMPPSPIASENSTGSSGDFELRKQTPAERERRLEDLKFHLRVFELYKQPAPRSLLTQYRFLLEGELLSEELKNEILTEIVPTRQCREFITQEVFRAGATRFEDDVTWRLRTLLKLAPVEGQAGRVLIDVLLGIIRELNAKENRTAPWFIELQRHVHCWPVIDSPHPRFRQAIQKKAKTTEKDGYKSVPDLLENVGLGIKWIYRSGVKWDPDDMATRLAISVIEYVYAIKPHIEIGARVFGTTPTELGELESEIWTLPEFPEQIERWGEVATKIFKEAFPNARNNPAFSQLFSKNTRASARTSEITAKLRDRLETLAGLNKAP